MSTSRHEGRIVLPSDFGGEDDQFCDTVYLKHGLLNGLNHSGDEWAQVRCNVMVPTLSLKTGTFTHAAMPSVNASDDADAWTLVCTRPVPVTVLEPGTPYLFRFWIAMTSDDAGCDFTIRAVLVPSTTPITDGLVLEESDSVWESDLIGGGDPIAYATGATLGAGAYANAIEMPDGPVDGSIAVFVQTTSDAGILDLHALHLSEVVPV